MKYPANNSALHEARIYANESINYTADFQGWQDGHKKYQRILTGRFCQAWLTQLMIINNIPCTGDNSTPYTEDSGDLHINGWNIDCKASVHRELAGQISSAFDRPDNSIDLYCFFVTDKSCSFIEPLGFIGKSKVIESSARINCGETILETGFTQRFNYSYFVDMSMVKSFDEIVEWLRLNPKSMEK
ncbi:MAG: hypothetical protein DRR06_18755 [Gammaproteobacteria bacterium]|nr:MAG: hypothetical protein DRR06_18755 [Gammaproteobacteria bacterium]